MLIRSNKVLIKEDMETSGQLLSPNEASSPGTGLYSIELVADGEGVP